MRQHTSGFPLVLVYLSFAVRVHDIHPLQKWHEFMVIMEFLKYFMDLFSVERVQAIFCGQSGNV